MFPILSGGLEGAVEIRKMRIEDNAAPQRPGSARLTHP
jgi:hypothetical protein